MTNDNGVLNRENEEEDEDKNTGSQTIPVGKIISTNFIQRDEGGFEFEGSTVKLTHKQIKVRDQPPLKCVVFEQMIKANEELQGMERIGRNRKHSILNQNSCLDVE